MGSALCLVIENDPTDDACQLGEWLTGAGLALEVRRPYAGQEVPPDPSGYAAVVVMGGHQHVYPTQRPVDPWLPRVESLLRRCVSDRVPALGVGLGAQLLAQAHGGTVGPATAGPQIGPRLVAKRDAAERDPLFGPLPMLPDVLAWHADEITELPLGAVLLATSPDHPVQGFRVGASAWGIQFHIECDTGMFARWAADNGPALAALGLSFDEVVGSAAAVMDDLFEVWHPFATRFAAVARGDLALGSPPPPGIQLPLLGG